MTTTNDKGRQRPPFAPPHGFAVRIEVFYTQTCVTLLERKRNGKFTEYRKYWLDPDEFTQFILDWHKLGADVTMHRHWGRSSEPLPLGEARDVLPQIEGGDTTEDSGRGDADTPTQLGFDLR